METIKGRSIGGQCEYNLLRSIGSGTFGEVFLSRRNSPVPALNNKLLAVKKVPSISVSFTESRMMLYLQHPNIIQYFDTFVSNGFTYMAMELADCNLHEMRARGPIEYNVIRHIARETLQGLKYMHSLDIVHLDIKSVNVLMHHGTIKIGDFGSASSLPVGNEVKGTLYWMAPELIFTYWDSQFYTKKCDVWSFGVMLLEMLEGAAPYVNLNRGKYMKFIRSNRYAGHQLSDDGPEWHQKFALVMKRALSVDPTERATVAEVLGIVEDMRVEDKEELKRRYLTL